MKYLILALSGVFIILLVVVIALILTPSNLKPPSILIAPTLTITPITKATPTAYPEYLLPSPEQLAPEEDPNAYEKLPKDQQEFSSLVVMLPIKTSDYSIEFNFANSTFNVVIQSDQGMKDYEVLRKKFSSLKDSLFTVVDQRAEPT